MNFFKKVRICNLQQLSGMMSIIESNTYDLYNETT
jgi:hypothetical protein